MTTVYRDRLLICAVQTLLLTYLHIRSLKSFSCQWYPISSRAYNTYLAYCCAQPVCKIWTVYLFHFRVICPNEKVDLLPLSFCFRMFITNGTCCVCSILRPSWSLCAFRRKVIAYLLEKMPFHGTFIELYSTVASAHRSTCIIRQTCGNKQTFYC